MTAQESRAIFDLWYEDHIGDENKPVKAAAWEVWQHLYQPVKRTPLSADDIKEPKNGEVWRVEWWNESLRMMLPSGKVLHRFTAYRNGTLQFTLKARDHRITQEKPE